VDTLHLVGKLTVLTSVELFKGSLDDEHIDWVMIRLYQGMNRVRFRFEYFSPYNSKVGVYVRVGRNA
jgi:hypothetical protein